MAKILKDIGQCAIKSEGVEYIFTPSFINLAQLGSPTEIVDKFGYVFDELAMIEVSSFKGEFIKRVKLSLRAELALSYSIDVLKCCGDKDLPESLVGCFTDKSYRISNNECKVPLAEYNLSCRFSGMQPCDIILAARSLLDFGLIGNEEMRGASGDSSGNNEGFCAYKFISFAETPYPMGLGLSRKSAENMTMTSFKIHYENTFPEYKKAKEDDKDLQDANDFFDSILEMRAAAEA